MKTKIVVGIIIGIIIVIGLGYGFGTTENNVDGNSDLVIDEIQVVESPENDEGTQFTIELSDSVQTTGP